MSEREVRFTVDLAIKPGKLVEFESVAKAMVDATRNEHGVLAYDFFLNADRSKCRLVEAYAGPAAALAHLTGPVVREMVPKLLAAASLKGFECYGDPGAKVSEILQGFGAHVFELRHALNA